MRNFNRLASISAIIPLLGLALAAEVEDKRDVTQITNELGCGAKGPFQSDWAQEFFACTEGSQYTCQATDSTGCMVGDPSNIESLTIIDTVNSQALGGSANVAKATFTCPEHEFISCAILFTSDTAGASYGIRIVEGTGDNSTSTTTNSTASLDTDDSTASSTGLDTSSSTATNSFGFGNDDSVSSTGSLGASQVSTAGLSQATSSGADQSADATSTSSSDSQPTLDSESNKDTAGSAGASAIQAASSTASWSKRGSSRLPIRMRSMLKDIY